MKEFSISSKEAGQRMDKYLFKILNQASKGFVYKMLRKKNIVLPVRLQKCPLCTIQNRKSYMRMRIF